MHRTTRLNSYIKPKQAGLLRKRGGPVFSSPMAGEHRRAPFFRLWDNFVSLAYLLPTAEIVYLVTVDRKEILAMANKIGRKYSYEELSAFCLQISLLLSSAIPLDEGLSIMAEDAATQAEKDMLLYISEEVELGEPFAEALEKRRHFRRMWSEWPGWDSRRERWIRSWNPCRFIMRRKMRCSEASAMR